MLWVPSAFGQAVYGSILGTVTDPSGAAVTGAKITVTSQTKNVAPDATSNESGNYSVTHLIPDIYVVRIEGTGFKSLEYKGVQVSADTGAKIDGQFQVGSDQSEQVEVTSRSPQLKTDREDVAVEFTSKQLEELPIFNRNFQSLELLTPGTQVIEGWSHAATENPQGSKQIFVNGQHFSGTGYELDGTDNQDAILGIIIVNPSLDSVTETKMTTQNYDAEFGKAMRGIMTAQTQVRKQRIPRQRLFLRFGSGQSGGESVYRKALSQTTGSNMAARWADPSSRTSCSSSPTMRERGARKASSFLSRFRPDLVRQTCLTAPVHDCDLQRIPYCRSERWRRPGVQPIRPAGIPHVIPKQHDPSGRDDGRGSYLRRDAPSRVAEKILALLPAPNSSGAAGSNGTVDNYSANGSGSFNDYQYTGRVDYAINQKMNIFGRYSHAHFTLTGAPVFGDAIGGPGLGPIGLAGNSTINNYSLATGFDYTLSTSLLTDFRFGWFRYNPHSTKFDATAQAATALGLPGLNTSDPTTGGLPAMIFDQTIGAKHAGQQRHRRGSRHRPL